MKIELFDEVYSANYMAIFHIIKRLSEKEYSEDDFFKMVNEEMGHFSFMKEEDTPLGDRIKRDFIVDEEKLHNISAEEEMWPLFIRVGKGEDRIIKSALENISELPLSMIERMWIAAICSDPRIKLFYDELPFLEDIEPLFDYKDYFFFDKKCLGDPYSDEKYVKIFRKVLRGVRNLSCLEITYLKQGRRQHLDEAHLTYFRDAEEYIRCILDPKYIEYSERDDRFGLVGKKVTDDSDSKVHIPISSIVKCEEKEWEDSFSIYHDNQLSDEEFRIKLIIDNRHNVLERFAYDFSHCKKKITRSSEEGKFIVKINYPDENDFATRILSYGPYIKVEEPNSLVCVIKEKILDQMSLLESL